MAFVSYGPGVSIDASVKARMNGGDSCTIGITVDGMVTICLSTRNLRSPASRACTSASSVRGLP